MMYFYTFLQPEIFSESADRGEDSMQNMVSILKNFYQNCFLAVFEDDRWSQSIKEILEKWPETFARTRAKKLLKQMGMRNRFLYCIIPDYSGVKSDLDCMFEQAESIPLDLIMVIDAEKDRSIKKGIELTTSRDYQATSFEPKRSAIAVKGKTCVSGEMDNTSFLNYHFARALKYASEIHICDKICGRRNLADNYIYTIKQFIPWLGKNLVCPDKCKLVFHLGQPAGEGIDFILRKMTGFRQESLPTTEIELRFYGDTAGMPNLPHQRFILTNQIALNIDRGLDFLDRNTHKCRDTFISCQDPGEAQKLLRHFSSMGVDVRKVS
ncbi:MAG: hypothetical protein QUS35_10895 [bacterium]|nr:hypothetical protein [bacterium]